MIIMEADDLEITRIRICREHAFFSKLYAIYGPDGETELSVSDNVWDCLGDLMLCLSIAEDAAGNGSRKIAAGNGSQEIAAGNGNQEIAAGNGNREIWVKGKPGYSPRYYNAEGLCFLYMEIRKKGWKIHMENENRFYLKCLEFEEIRNPFQSEDGSRKGVEKRNYAHPIDSGIIKVLDMPGVKNVFGAAVDALTDLNYSEILSSGILVNEKSFPEIHDIVEHCVAVLGIKRPYVVVSNAIALNAFTVGSDEEPYIVLGNMLVRVMDTVKLRFIIGHECGHIAMGHVIYHSVVSMAGSFSNVIPVIGPMVYKTSSLALVAWSRRSEITADRAGLLCCLDVGEAKKALLQTQSGFIDANQLDLKSYVKNSKRYGRRSVLRRVNEFLQAHPPISKRMEALDLFVQSELYYTAQGTEAPVNCISEQELASSVEHIIAVLGEE